MTFDFKEFVNNIHNQFVEKLSLDQTKQILDIGDQFTRDTPISTGKRLIITRIAFSGVKRTEETNSYAGDIIDYDQSVNTGINMWIADNLKGKSSIFKILKYALTGANSIKPNIKKWIHHILVNFTISDREYTIYMETKSRLKASLYNGTIDKKENIGQHESDIIFSTVSETDYQHQIQDFFFKQFAYYSLKWTQKSPQKDSTDLLEVGASWKTYFKSIFLESSDSSVMYGDQGKKVFQMLLGLELTYPINYFSVEKDKLVFEKAKRSSIPVQNATAKKEQVDRLVNRLKEINELLRISNEQSKSSMNLNSLYAEHDRLVKTLQAESQRLLTFESQISTERTALEALKEKRNRKMAESQRINKELLKTQRQIGDLEEYLEIGIFFSNLDIKQCPSCSHTVTDIKKKKAAVEKVCALCNDHVELEDTDVNKEEYQQKVENLKLILSNFQHDLEGLDHKDDQIEYDEQYNKIISLEQQKIKGADTSAISFRLEEISKIFETENGKVVLEDPTLEKLISERAVIQYQLDEKPSESGANNFDDTDIKIEVLTAAIAELNKQRYAISLSVLNRLSDLMLAEIHDMGLTSISEIEINEKFDIRYKQDGDFIGFENIAEGEQLRAKIALYLSLIQLDIEFNFGRHTRFLIIDSPAKEEADANYMAGLSLLLKTIEQRFGSQLQILIGTAERSLLGAVPQEIVTPQHEFVF
ncbi:hypothetical protein [Taibaiella chishuiensis]|uniref:AAA domain-containing protein n=1 Tax=Taibaiella chishuiensis TaxID=1434707 RepID=A0A2P8D4S0_9BACT|nr:hypothetical protein [Taibaiella chishuiensis]PSK92221.1 hypothetical protein B0I18_104320 [Taibaiella chishuiensis]